MNVQANGRMRQGRNSRPNAHIAPQIKTDRIGFSPKHMAGTKEQRGRGEKQCRIRRPDAKTRDKVALREQMHEQKCQAEACDAKEEVINEASLQPAISADVRKPIIEAQPGTKG